MTGCRGSQRALPDPNTVDLWSVPTTSRHVRSRRVARGSWLRQVLSEYVGGAPGDLELRHGAYGKPRLAQPSLHFSMSSTQDAVVLAVASSLVGVDAEPFSRPGAAFLRRWTIQEAVSKAVGCGLGSELSVEIDWSSKAPRMARLGHDDPDAWTLVTQLLPGETLVSIAVRTPAARLNLCASAAVDAREGVAS